MTATSRLCDALGDHTGPVRLYACGRRCSAHAPWTLAGRPEPRPGPGAPAGAWATPSPQSASALIDARAIASGKRRSSPHTYRAAQAAVVKATTARSGPTTSRTSDVPTTS
ncbi:hypothetical protein ACH4GK_17685 [Streptomyces rimosus]|uniref:hypothetical protein n=1 Tax=Streptomyces rimosus TaxID=1927 RepID=UPI000A949F21|nr:hypothetical protein [Streptomyces rimosus]